MFVCSMQSPSDMASVERLFEEGIARPECVIAVVGKMEGTGLHDDYGRALADLRLREVLASHQGIHRDDVADRVTFVLSGGCFGVISPHVTIITRETLEVAADQVPEDERLVIGRAHSEPLRAEDIGRMTQIRRVAEATRAAMADAGITEAAAVHAVLVKAPGLSRASIADAEARGKTVVTRDLSVGEDNALSFSNDASALGVALALGEVRESDLSDEVVRRDWELYSSVAATSSGAEKSSAEVLLFGNGRPSLSMLRVGHGLIRDPIDLGGVKDALRSAGLRFDCCPSAEDQERIVQVFAKLAVPGSPTLRGHRSTMLDDPEAYRSAKAVGGTLVASVTGDPRVFVSGGEKNSHQGPPGGNPVAAVVRVQQGRVAFDADCSRRSTPLDVTSAAPNPRGETPS
jgi:cyanuric acid amidohydrolase